MNDGTQVFGGWHLCDLCGEVVGNDMAERTKHKNVCLGVGLEALAKPAGNAACDVVPKAGEPKEFKFVEMGSRVFDDQLPVGTWSEPDPSWNHGKSKPDTFMRHVAGAISDMLGEEVRWVNVPDKCHNPLCERGFFSTCGGGKVSRPISIRQFM